MRIVIKLSGEALAGNKNSAFPYDRDTIETITKQITSLREEGNEIALVVGGGNLFRGKDLEEKMGVERATGDYIGMLSTVENALVLRDYFEARNIQTRVSSAITMAQICESYMPMRALRHLEKGRVVIFAGGLGAPYFTTDSTAVQRALEMRADLLVMAKSGVEGVMTADPKKEPAAELLRFISCSEILAKELMVADPSAIALAKEHGLHMKVVGIGSIANATHKTVGTEILPE